MAHADSAAALRMLHGLRRLSQRELARRTGVHHATISQFERGKRLLGRPQIERLLHGLNVPPRGYEATERLVDWIDYLVRTESSGQARHSLILAESVARSYEVHTAALLHLVEGLSGGDR
ncbi:MAG: helix-turn-helix transcriptional regulator [Acidobacteriota bacterium]|jgi:transcriptional regulator with XRE-family HTH domain